LPPILERIHLDEHQWLRHTRFFEARFKRVAGTVESIKNITNKLGRKWFHYKTHNKVIHLRPKQKRILAKFNY